MDQTQASGGIIDLLGLIFFASMNQQVPTIQSNANASDFTFTREEFESAPTRQLLRDGRAANAIVWRLQKNGITWTVKDFSKRSWFVRTFIGPFLIRRELAALSRLKKYQRHCRPSLSH